MKQHESFGQPRSECEGIGYTCLKCRVTSCYACSYPAQNGNASKTQTTTNMSTED